MVSGPDRARTSMQKILISLVFVLGLLGQAAVAQDERFYIQVEARTSLAAAQDSVRSFAGRFDNINGFALGGGWYGVALGPYASRDQAAGILGALLRGGQVPPDSYVESSRTYGQQFWPVGAQVPLAAGDTADAGGAAAQPAVPQNPVLVAPAPQPAVPAPVPDETPQEARASERLLSRAERDDLQIALQWAGFYEAAIDGAFGPGTRRAMADWQSANGYEPTGVLTSRQRVDLLRQYNAVLDGMGMAEVFDPRAGIRMQMPTGVVAFDRYEAPFALYESATDLGAQVLLISQPATGPRSTACTRSCRRWRSSRWRATGAAAPTALS
jgi:hypothetical protein